MSMFLRTGSTHHIKRIFRNLTGYTILQTRENDCGKLELLLHVGPNQQFTLRFSNKTFVEPLKWEKVTGTASIDISEAAVYHKEKHYFTLTINDSSSASGWTRYHLLPQKCGMLMVITGKLLFFYCK